MIKWLLAFLLIVGQTFGATFYVKQTATGTGDGSTLANAASVATSNAHTYSPGDICSLNGTITSEIIVSQSGSSGNPITYLFATGCVMSSPVWSGNGAIYINAESYITIDGGSNGIIECTANGTDLANQLTATGVNGNNAEHLTVQNLSVLNMYVFDKATDTSDGHDTYCISDQDGGTGGVNYFTVNNCTCTWARGGVYFDYGSATNGNNTVEYCTIYNCNFGMFCGDRNSSGVISNVVIHDNNIYDFTGWTDGADTNHHNGIYFEAENGGTFNNATIYNNTIGPGMDYQNTSGMFFSGATFVGPILIYDNVFLADANISNGLITQGGGPGVVFRDYNNTFIGVGGSSTNGGAQGAIECGSNHGGTQTFDIKNNLITNVAIAVGLSYYPSSVTVTCDYNNYYELGSASGPFQINSAGFGSNNVSYTTWQGSGFDANSPSGNPSSNPNLTGAYVPNSGSPVIGAGTPLTSYFTLDKAGNVWTTPWGIGAFQYEGSSPLTAGSLSQTSVGANVANLTSGAATGGTSPYTYQWYRSTTSGFTPGGGNEVSGATSLTLNDTGLTPSTNYYYKVVATDSVPNTATSSQLEVTTDATLTAGTLSSSAIGATIATVTSGAATGGSGGYTYQWYRSLSSGFTPGGGSLVSGATSLTLNDTGLSVSTTYYYKLVSTDSVSETVTSSQLTVTTYGTLTAGTLSSSNIGATVATVTSGVATGGNPSYTYQWYRSTSSGFTPGGGNILAGKTSLTLNDTGLSVSTTYYYKMVSTDGVGATITSSQLSLTTYGTLTAGTLSQTSVGESVASVASTAATGGNPSYTYQWYRSTSSGFTPGGGNIVNGATSLTLNDTGLTGSTNYYYKVVSTDGVGETVTSSQLEVTTTSATVGVGTAPLGGGGGTF